MSGKIEGAWLMKSGLNLFLFAFVMVAGATSAQAASGIRWYNGQRGAICAQVDSFGNFVQQLPYDVCLQRIGAKVDWRDTSSGVKCLEVTPEGFVIQETDDSYCMKKVGAKAVWQNTPSGVVCAEVTPKGSLLQYIADSYCTASAGPKPGIVPAAKPVPPVAPITPVIPPTTSGTGATDGNGGDSNPVVVATKSPGYHWSDLSSGVCIRYDESGRPLKMAPPLMCDGNH
jgi:hypothetical protein